MKTCGSCRWRMNSRRSTDFGRCSVAAELGSSDPRMPEDDSICPAFDDGSYDKAVDDLLRAAAEYLEVGTSSFRDSLEEAIEAARVAKEESGK